MCLFSAPVPQQPAPPINTPDYTPDQSEKGVSMTVATDKPVTPPAPQPDGTVPAPKRSVSGRRAGLKM